ncbi:MAG: tRNA lysidine(34) synthetase TilS [Fibrobacteria bacterium]|nr:tRNA lysidine(34) synthetase TilS [Fibrobacteria bacterium]
MRRSPAILTSSRPSLAEELAEKLRARRLLLAPPWNLAPMGLCLSGGADSCALAWVGRHLRDAGEDVTALHALHGLRGRESEEDRLAVHDLCARTGLPLIEVDARLPAGSDLESRAREVRYRSLREAFPGLLLTAHHRQDQAETVVLRLLRGAGPLGLQGIQPLREDGVWRPFLDESPRTLREICREAGWVWREDSSNGDLRHTRNWVRHVWLPGQGAPAEDALVHLAHAAQQLGPRLEGRLDALGSSADVESGPEGFRIDLSPWKGCPLPDPELDLLLERLWTRSGRRPWARQQRDRLVADVLSGRIGRRSGGQGEQAIWGSFHLKVMRINLNQ